MILFDDVYKSYPNGTNALNGVSFEISDGEFVFIIGASGGSRQCAWSAPVSSQTVKGKAQQDEYQEGLA